MRMKFNINYVTAAVGLLAFTGGYVAARIDFSPKTTEARPEKDIGPKPQKTMEYHRLLQIPAKCAHPLGELRDSISYMDGDNYFERLICRTPDGISRFVKAFPDGEWEEIKYVTGNIPDLKRNWRIIPQKRIIAGQPDYSGRNSTVKEEVAEEPPEKELKKDSGKKKRRN